MRISDWSSDVCSSDLVPLIFEPSFRPRCETARETARHRPEAVGANAGGLSHRMAHQAAHAAVAIWNGVDPIEEMMRGRHRDAALRLSETYARHHSPRRRTDIEEDGGTNAGE